MRQLTQTVPQHIHNPEHYEVAEMAAFTPYGTSEAAAIVACILYFMFFCCAVANYVYTNYPFYDVLIISTAFRTAAFGVRAAYTISYKPQLAGTWLAFNNAGFGANTATLCLALGTWINKVGHLYYSKWEQRIYMIWAYTLVASVIVFGPICGVIAAGLEYGDWDAYGSSYGERLRFGASYGLVACVVGLLMLSARLALSAYITGRTQSGRKAPTEEHPGRQPKLVIMFFICAMFLAIRGATGCVAIYLPMKYEKYWAEDKYFYPLDTLPELIVLVIMSWPAFLARMAQSWPKSLKIEDKYKDKSNQGSNKQADGQMVDGQQSPNTASDGSHTTSKAVTSTHVTD